MMSCKSLILINVYKINLKRNDLTGSPMGFPFLSTVTNAINMKDELDNHSHQYEIYAKFNHMLNLPLS
jgi:hypothetical protein